MTFRDSEIFLLGLNIGEGYNDVVVTKRTNKRIYLSDGKIVHIKDAGNFKYLDGKYINQILRDIEGYMINMIHCMVQTELTPFGSNPPAPFFSLVLYLSL